MQKKPDFFKKPAHIVRQISSFFGNASAQAGLQAAQCNETNATLYLEQEPHIVFENRACYTLSMRMKLDAENLPMPLCAFDAMEHLLNNHTVFTHVSELNQTNRPVTEMPKSEAFGTRFCVLYVQSNLESPTAEETLFLSNENELLAITQGMNQQLVSALNTARSMGVSVLCSQTGFAQSPPICVYQQRQAANTFLAEMPDDIMLQYPCCNEAMLISISTEQECEEKLAQTLKAFASKTNRKLQVLFPVDGAMMDI